jgi:hypothetical protein
VSHVEGKQPSTASHAGGIGSIEKPRWIGHKTKFPCKIYKGDCHTHLFPRFIESQRFWSMFVSSSNSESSEVPSQSIQPLFDEVIIPMKSSANPTHILWGDAPSNHVVSQFIQPMVEKVVTPMQSSADSTLPLESVDSTKVVTLMQTLTDTTLIMESVVSTDYVLSISSSVLLEQGGIPLTSRTPRPSPRMVSLD